MMLFSAQGVGAKTLLVFGDSLSAAYNMAPELGWVSLLEKRLQIRFPEIQVINSSISGETTSGGLSRLPKLLDRHQPDYIVLELAANDGLYGIPLNIIEENILKLIQLSKKADAQVILVGVRLPPNYGPRYTRRFFNMFETLADSEQVERVPFLMDKVALKPELMQADRLHPNAKAQPIILENVWPSVERVMGLDN